MSMEEVRWEAVFPGIEASIPMIQSKFPPFSAKSVHLSVNLPTTQAASYKDNKMMTHQVQEDRSACSPARHAGGAVLPP